MQNTHIANIGRLNIVRHTTEELNLLTNGQIRNLREEKIQIQMQMEDINTYLNSHNVGSSSNQKKRERKNMVESLRAINFL